jgi:autotransporter passenger strand-loop-strand repeat protein
VLGRFLLVAGTIGNMSNSYGPLDLFHYSSPGVRDFVGTQAGYFSINGSNTNLDNFNTKQNGDFGDWVVTARNDAFLAFSNPGVDNAVSPPDLREMNVLGYDFATATVSSGETHSATGIESDIVLSGGTVVVAPAGTSIDAIVESGGYDVISSGGTADATALGGTEFVLAGGWPTAPRSRAVSRLSNPAGSRAVRLSTAAIKSSSPGGRQQHDRERRRRFDRIGGLWLCHDGQQRRA